MTNARMCPDCGSAAIVRHRRPRFDRLLLFLFFFFFRRYRCRICDSRFLAPRAAPPAPRWERDLANFPTD